MPLSKEEIAQEEQEIRALEQLAKERWCRLKGHKWDLPQPNPLNAGDVGIPDMLACRLRCNRCACQAALTIAIDTSAAAAAPVPVVAAPVPVVATEQVKRRA